MAQRRLIKIREVINRIGDSKSSIYRQIAAGTFPHPVKVSENERSGSRWVEDEIDDLVERRIAARDAYRGDHDPQRTT